MSGIILFVLFIMNLLTIFAVVLLYIRTGSNTDSLRQQEAVMKQTEDMLSAFLLEMKEENDAVIESLGNIRSSQREEEFPGDPEKDAASHRANGQENPAPDIGQGHELAVHERDILELSPEALKKAGQHHPAEKPSKQSFTEALSRELNKSENRQKTLAEQVSELTAAGHSPEDIARKLNKGKTEIELLLKVRT